MDKETFVARSRASFTLLVAVGLLSASGLTFELTLTRIFSATIWYHYAFVAISVALFGWGLGGFLVYILGLAGLRKHAKSLLVVLSLALSVTLPLFSWGILQFPFTPERLHVYFLLSLLPFLAGGAALSLAFERHGRDANRLYFADLLGAALGTLAVPLVIGLLGAMTTVLATAVLPAAAAVLLSLPSKESRSRGLTFVSAVFLAGTVALVAWNFHTETFAIRDAPDKALYKLLRDHPQARIESDRWNAYSRVTSVTGFDNYHAARLFIDSDAETSVLRWDGKTDDLVADGPGPFRAFPLRLAPEGDVLVIGPGGGVDIVLSIISGSRSVTAVEMNPLIVDSVRRLGAQSGNVYDHPKVHLVVDEGRSFMQRTNQRFDLIILGFVDSWAAVAGGGLSLTENYLYTREAMEAYYDHLTERGALVIVRWQQDVPRLVANSVDFLSDRGMSIADIGQHLLAVSERKSTEPGPVATIFMLSRSPLTKSTVDKLLAGHSDAHLVHVPTRESDARYKRLFAGEISFDQYTDSFETMATPVPDDRPFYFAVDKPRGIPGFVVKLLTIPVVAVIGFAALLVVAGRLRGFRTPGLRAVAYFGALGAGFIVCEVAVIQRLILLLGHPTYTFVVILFTFLLSGGLGSLFARRFDADKINHALRVIIILVVALIALGAFALPPIVRAAIPLNLSLRVLVAGLLVFPFGFVMGMPFPLGLRRSAQDPQGAPVSALWGINGVASVVGSAAGMMLALAAGFTWVFLAAALCYVVAWAARPK